MKNKKEIFGWAMFDFANSAYTTNIVTVIFALYFTQVIVTNQVDPAEGGGGVFDGLGGKTLWGAGNFVANLLIILTAPIIGAVADFSSCRKRFLVTTCLLCVICTAALFFATPGAVALALILYIVSNYFFQVSEALCGSFLPDLAEPEEVGRISGLGWSLGYIGGLVGLVLCLPLIGKGFGIDNEFNLRLTSLVTAGVFLIGAIPTFLFLNEHGEGRLVPPGKSYIGIGFSRVKETLTHLRRLYDLSFFLLAFFLMSVGLMTVFSFASIYSSEEMRFTGGQVFTLMISVQLSAAVGAFTFGFIQDKIGLKKNVQMLLIGWAILIVFIAFTHTVWLYVVLFLVLGAFLGSVQSGARGVVAMFAPPSKSAEIFGFWSLTYKLGGMIGPLLYGYVSDYRGQRSSLGEMLGPLLYGSVPDTLGQRTAMLCVSVFFLLAFLACLLVDEKRGRQAGLEFEEYLSRSSPS
jgi:MFS transporter, UMF1 family